MPISRHREGIHLSGSADIRGYGCLRSCVLLSSVLLLTETAMISASAFTAEAVQTVFVVLVVREAVVPVLHAAAFAEAGAVLLICQLLGIVFEDQVSLLLGQASGSHILFIPAERMPCMAVQLLSCGQRSPFLDIVIVLTGCWGIFVTFAFITFV